MMVASGFALRVLCDELCGGSTEFVGLDPHQLSVRSIQMASGHFMEKPRDERLALYRDCLAAFDCELEDTTNVE